MLILTSFSVNSMDEYVHKVTEPPYYSTGMMMQIDNPVVIITPEQQAFIMCDTVDVKNTEDLLRNQNCYLLNGRGANLSFPADIFNILYYDRYSFYPFFINCKQGINIDFSSRLSYGDSLIKFDCKKDPDFYTIYMIRGEIFNYYFAEKYYVDYTPNTDFSKVEPVKSLHFPDSTAYYKIVQPYYFPDTNKQNRGDEK